MTLEWGSLVIGAILGAVFGLILNGIYAAIAKKIRIHHEVKDNDNINISGTWYAAWQTSVHGKQLLNTEELIVKQTGKTVYVENTEKSPENPDGGYLWNSTMHFYQGRYLMGWYFPKKGENLTSKGIMYMVFSSQKKLFIGQWSGTGYDGDLETGFLVFSKDRNYSLEILSATIEKYPSKINIITRDI